MENYVLRTNKHLICLCTFINLLHILHNIFIITIEINYLFNYILHKRIKKVKSL